MLRNIGENWTRRNAVAGPQGKTLSCGLRVRTYCLKAPHLQGKTLLFASDFHIQNRRIYSVPGFSFASGIKHAERLLYPVVEQFKPDFFVFGGDLATESCLIPDCLSLFKEIGRQTTALAVPGNWDLRRKWLPAAYWRRWYQEASFYFLQNQSLSCPGIAFYGSDDFKAGDPVFPKNFLAALFRCVVCHNPDTVALLSDEQLAQIDLILCGHTHGGQIRVPWFGAIYSATLKWKRFEYGAYQHKNGRTMLLVTSGLGTTWLPFRIFNPPEVCLIRFVS